MPDLPVYIGYDPRETKAYTVCERSLKHHASIPLDIKPLDIQDLRERGMFWRDHYVDSKGQKWDGGQPFSTEFSFTRFCVPMLQDYEGEWALYVDPDFMWRADIAELMDYAEANEAGKALFCVKHDHKPEDRYKKGQRTLQARYSRKNWSSLILWKPDRSRMFNRYWVNNESGQTLHAFVGVPTEEIGGLDEAWNWLEGWSSPDIEPKAVHYTRGTPDVLQETPSHAGEWWDWLNNGEGK